MKKFALLLAVIMLVTMTAIVPVSAQEPASVYIPLASGDLDPSSSMSYQVSQSFTRLLPQLLKAKEQGLLSSFRLDVFGGFVQVEDASVEDLSAFLAVPVAATQAEAMRIDPEAQVLRGASVQISLSYYSSSFNILNLPADARVRARLFDPSGMLVAVGEHKANSSGYLTGYFEGKIGMILPGYKVTFQRVSDTGAVLQSWSSTVPNLSIKSFTKSTGAVSGTGPAGKQLRVAYEQPDLDADQSKTTGILNLTIGSTGKWNAAFGAGVRNGAMLDILLKQNNNFYYSLYGYIPAFIMDIGSSYLLAYNFPMQRMTIKITHAGKVYTPSYLFLMPGMAYVQILDGAGNFVFLQTGDKVEISGAVTQTIPGFTMAYDRTTKVVSGSAPANRFLQATMYSEYTHMTNSKWLKTNASGKFSFVITSFDPDPYELLYGTIHYTDKVTGNSFYYYMME